MGGWEFKYIVEGWGCVYRDGRSVVVIIGVVWVWGWGIEFMRLRYDGVL